MGQSDEVQNTQFSKMVQYIYHLIQIGLAFNLVLSPFIGYNPLAPIVAMICIPAGYLFFRWVGTLERSEFGVITRKNRVFIVLSLIILTSVLAYESIRIVTPPNISITNLQDSDEVPWKLSVEGSSSFEVFASRIWPEGLSQQLYVHVLLFPVEPDGPWFVQGSAIIQPDGAWEVYSYFGRDPDEYPQDIGDQFRVCAIITREKMMPGQTLQDFPAYLSVSRICSVIRNASQDLYSP